MKTIDEILNNYKEWETVLDDRFGIRLTAFLTEEQCAQIGFTFKDEYKGKHQPKEWTRENILEQLKEDVAFGFEKALDKRGMSSGLMYDVVLKWNRVLEDGLENWNKDKYAQYGLPLFKATAIKYGWDNPIGDDNGDEYKYSAEADY